MVHSSLLEALLTLTCEISNKQRTDYIGASQLDNYKTSTGHGTSLWLAGTAQCSTSDALKCYHKSDQKSGLLVLRTAKPSKVTKTLQACRLVFSQEGVQCFSSNHSSDNLPNQVQSKCRTHSFFQILPLMA